MVRKHILLIDDDTSLLVTLRDFLKFEGYEVTTAESGEKGLEVLETMNPDLIILDMSMPGMGGMGFLKAISSPEGRTRYPVLVLTAKSGMAEYFGKVDVQGFVAKPCDPQDLLMEVGRIIFLTGEEAAASIRQIGSDRRKVLLGDNDEKKLRELHDTFEAAGYETSAVGKGAEVIEQAIVDRPDVIVVKLLFGNVNGDTVARMLSEMAKTQDIPVVLYDDSGSAVSAREYGITGATIKKFISTNRPSEIVDAVGEVLGLETGV